MAHSSYKKEPFKKERKMAIITPVMTSVFFILIPVIIDATD